jgi:4-methylaminobutanoate oxidase (formaldehyde-forming)
MITRLATDEFLSLTGGPFVPRDMGWLTLHMPRDGSVEVKDVSADWACIGLYGPSARQALQAVSASDVSNAACPFMSARWIDIAGAQALALRVTYCGELGWEFYMENNEAVPMWQALMEAGQSYGIQPVGYKALGSLRLEKAYRLFSADTTPSDNLYEAGLDTCIDWEKGEFVGRKALLEARSAGLKQRLCTLTIDPSVVIYGGEVVFAGDRRVARLRSGGYGYTVGRNIGFAYIPLSLAEPGTQFEVEVFGERVAAKVEPDVLYDPEDQRLLA